MFGINLSSREKELLKNIDVRKLYTLIDQAVRDENPSILHPFQLSSCGSYVAAKYNAFQQAGMRHSKAKSSRKHAETHERLRRAGYDIRYAVEEMLQRVEQEEKEGELFFVYDEFFPSSFLSKHLSVRVRYRWRKTVDDLWQDGSITFLHEVVTRPDYTFPAPKRKPSAAKLREEAQDQLYVTWEQLTRSALESVKEYLRANNSGDSIPEEFSVVLDGYTGGLNNHSTDFWKHPSAD